jgi:predicted hotdog family 3-hydroxylacyl-ACP dehydratase
MDETHLDIQEYIPQRPPIVIIDRIIDINESMVVCQFKVNNDNLFVTDGKLLEPGIIENIAQTVAAGAGYRAKAKNEKVKLGYIAAIKHLNIYTFPIVGDVLSTKVLIVNEVFSVTIVQAEVICGSTRIADCEMRIFIEEN